MVNFRKVLDIRFAAILRILFVLIFAGIFFLEAEGLPRVSQEIIDKIKEKCVENYSRKILVELAMNVNVQTEKGGFFPSRIEDLERCFSTFLKPGMKFLDLGSGDGRVVFFASLFGVEATGIEYDSTLHQISMEAMRDLSGVIDTKKTHFIKSDFFLHDFSNYDILYLYEGTDDISGLKEKLSKEMKPGSILICIGPEVEIDNLILIQEFLEDCEHIISYRKIR